MSIFKESFRKFVRNQLKIREAIVAKGNNNDGRFTGGKVKLEDGKEVNIPGGAFFTNTVQRQCIIRMSSGCDLTDLGSKQFAEGGIYEKEKHIKGSGLARRYVLQGGTLVIDRTTLEYSDNTETTTEETTTTAGNTSTTSVATIKERTRKEKYKYKLGNRSGFRGVSPNDFGTAYGDPTIRANPGEDYGSVPMPGILSANIRTKSAYGSLREAKIEFTCHNQRQLEVLELLYMRPGIPILLEWGWNPYIDNNGDRRTDFPFIGDWWISEASMDDINRRIIQEKKNSGGNYDAIAGMCKNFSYKARPDGGFDCTTELIAQGEIIENLKGDLFSFPIDANQRTVAKEKNREGVFLTSIKEDFVHDVLELGLRDMQLFAESVAYMQDITSNEEDTEFDWSQAAADALGMHAVRQASDYFLTGQYDPLEEYEEYQYAFAGVLTPPSPFPHIGYYFDLQNAPIEEIRQYGTEEDSRETLILKACRTFILSPESYFGEIDQASLRDETAKSDFEIQAPYIRWDAFCTFLNRHVINKDALGNPVVSFSTNIVVDEDTDNPKVEPLLMSRSPIDKIPMISSNGSLTYVSSHTVYVDPDGTATSNWGKDINMPVGAVLNASIDPTICLFPEQLSMSQNGAFSPFLYLGAVALGFGVGTAVGGGVGGGAGAVVGAKLYREWAGDTEMRVGNRNIRNIGHIYFNIDRLIAIFKEQRYNQEGELNDDFNLHDYIKKIWDDASAASGNKYKFIIHNDLERPNVLRIIDANFQKDENLRDEDIHTLKIQSNDTICRDFSYNSVIPNELSATIGVAMQNPDSVQDIDGATFAALAKGIRSRFHVPNAKEKELPTEEEIEKKSKGFDALVSNCVKNFEVVAQLVGLIQNGDAQKIDAESGVGSSDFYTELIGKARVSLKQFFNQTNQIHTLHEEDGQYPAPSGQTGEKYYKGFKKKINSSPPVSSVIPLKFNAKLDGIGGITIGNLFKVDPTRLPKAYRQSDVGFICMGEQQAITAGQDWTTDIHGQLVLLPRPVSEENTKTGTGGSKEGTGTGPLLVGDTDGEGTPDTIDTDAEAGTVVGEDASTAEDVNNPEQSATENELDQQDQCPEGYYYEESIGECVLEGEAGVVVDKSGENYDQWLENLAGFIKNYELMRFVDYQHTDLHSAQGLTFLAPQNTKQEIMWIYFNNARIYANNVKVLSKGIEEKLIALLMEKVKENEGIDPYASDISVTSGGVSYNTFVDRERMVMFANVIHNSPGKGEYNSEALFYVENYLQIASGALKDAMRPHSERVEGEGLGRKIYEKYGDFQMTHPNYIAYYEFYTWFSNKP